MLKNMLRLLNFFLSSICATISILLVYVYFWDNSEVDFLTTTPKHATYFNITFDRNKRHKCVAEEDIYRHEKLRSNLIPNHYLLRQIKLDKECRTLYGHGLGPDIDYENFVAEPNTGLLYCVVYKVASTNWLKMLMLLSKKRHSTSPKRAKNVSFAEQYSKRFGRYGKQLTEMASPPKSVTKRLSPFRALGYFDAVKSNWGKGQIADGISMLDAHYKNNLYSGHKNWARTGCFANISRHFLAFTFFRHPFERLVSAYLDKFTLAAGAMNRFYQLHLGTFIIAHFRPNATRASKVLGHDVTFEEFIDYVLYENSKTTAADKLWRPFSRLCSPCRVHFDVLARFETFTDDKNFILHLVAQRAGLNFGRVRRQFPTLRHDTLERKTRTRKKTVKSYMKMIERNKIEALVEIYRDDFQLTAYKYLEYLG